MLHIALRVRLRSAPLRMTPSVSAAAVEPRSGAKRSAAGSLRTPQGRMPSRAGAGDGSRPLRRKGRSPPTRGEGTPRLSVGDGAPTSRAGLFYLSRRENKKATAVAVAFLSALTFPPCRAGRRSPAGFCRKIHGTCGKRARESGILSSGSPRGSAYSLPAAYRKHASSARS